MMIGRVKALFGLDEDAAKSLDPEDELRHAAAVILVEAALVDGFAAEEELAEVKALLEKRFELSSEAADTLIGQARAVAEDATDYERFTRVIKEQFGADERIDMMQMLWQVLLADGVLDAYEDSLARRIAALLHVTDRDRALAKRRARDALDAEHA
jgi:uncharacterized tellurite resistance protein B-like protein